MYLFVSAHTYEILFFSPSPQSSLKQLSVQSTVEPQFSVPQLKRFPHLVFSFISTKSVFAVLNPWILDFPRFGIQI
jgi:hypothetical protein